MIKEGSRDIKEYKPEDQMKDFMEENTKGHYNNEPDYKYKISSGSLSLDLAMKGGLGPGINRLVGLSEGGKSSCAISFVRNFFNIHQNSRAIFIPSEGKRLEILCQNAEDLLVTSDYTKWINHSCFSYRTNVFELAMKVIRNFIQNNPTNTRYIFIVDSVDALVPAGDIEKGFEEAVKVAGGALLASNFGKQMSLMITSCGHLVLLISQVRKSDINISKYTGHEDKVLDNVSGGNALIHYADWILQFQGHRARKDKIWSGAEGTSDILGHFCEIDFMKAPKNITGKTCRYPIKYLPDGSSQIWSAYEIADNLIKYELADARGAWVNITMKIIEDCKNAGLDIQEKHNGISAFRRYFDENKEISEFLFAKLRDALIL